MTRLSLLVLALATVWIATSRGMIDPAMALTALLPPAGLVAAISLLAGLAGIALGFLAIYRTRQMRRDLNRLLAGTNTFMQQHAKARTAEIAALGSLGSELRAELELLQADAARAHLPAQAGPPPVKPANVISLRRDGAAQEMERPAERPATAPHAMAEASVRLHGDIQRWFDNGAFDISLQPIVSLSAGTVIAHEAHAHIGEDCDLRRLPADMTGMDACAFEHRLVDRALRAARRQYGLSDKRQSIHVAVSHHLLSRRAAMRELDTLFDSYGALTRLLVLSVPIECLEREDTRWALLSLRARGIGLCIEARQIAQLARKLDCAMVKLPARGLAALGEGEIHASVAAAIAQGGLQFIATDVVTGEEAARLGDIGIDLMMGPRFGKPALARRPGPAQGRTAAE